MTVISKGPWKETDINDFLQQSVFPVRLACTAPDGFPRVVSVWFRYSNHAFTCVSHRDSKLIALLKDNDKVGFEVSPNDPPYCGVRGQALASLTEAGAGEELECLLERYLGSEESKLGNWLLSRREEEVLITLRVQRIFSWDYRERMSG
ncbi:MAG: hypothetical protein AB8C02_16840 [Halioglobus sp.]